MAGEPAGNSVYLAGNDNSGGRNYRLGDVLAEKEQDGLEKCTVENNCGGRAGIFGSFVGVELGQSP